MHECTEIEQSYLSQGLIFARELNCATHNYLTQYHSFAGGTSELFDIIVCLVTRQQGYSVKSYERALEDVAEVYIPAPKRPKLVFCPALVSSNED